MVRCSTWSTRSSTAIAPATGPGRRWSAPAGFRDRQIEWLRALAQNLGEKALQTKQIVELQPMTPHDRRIVHMAIAEMPGLSSRSEGEGEDRHILVVPAAAE